MTLEEQGLTKDISSIDVEEILSCWQWRIGEMQTIIAISCLGDLFLLGKDKAVYWLQTDSGDLTKIADNIEQYQEFLTDQVNTDNWFLPLLIIKLLNAGKTLKANEVYSYKKLPVIGGKYTIDNIEPSDMSIHFAFSGQICEQIKDLPEGSKVTIKFEK